MEADAAAMVAQKEMEEKEEADAALEQAEHQLEHQLESHIIREEAAA